VIVGVLAQACSRPASTGRPAPEEEEADSGVEPAPAGGSGGGGRGGAGGRAGAGGAGGVAMPDAAAGGADARAEDAGARPEVASDGLPSGGTDLRPGDMPLPPASEPAAPIGEGWTEIFPVYKMDQPPGQIRHTVTDGEFHLWLFNNDASTYPGRDSGPRSELHIRNNYTTGQAQFQADIKIDPNCSGVSVMQVFGGSRTATGFMAFVQGNNLTHYSAETIATNIRGRWFRLNVIHNTATHRVDVYIDGQRRAGYEDHGPATHYFKCGLYHQRNMTPRCDAWFKNFHIFKK
jgi:hypothetical protein